MMLQEKGEMSIAIKKLTPFPTTYPLIQKLFIFMKRGSGWKI